MKTLIAGLGSIGRRHLRNLLTLGERDILLYRTGKSTLPEITGRGAALEIAGAHFSASDLSGISVFNDLKTALAQGPDAAIIANPTALHLDVAIPAALAGCHLLLEKPVSHSLERLDELQAALARGGGRVLTGHHFRYHPGLQAAAALLARAANGTESAGGMPQAPAIGKPLSFRAHWGEYLPGWHPWENYQDGYSARADLGGGVTLTLSHPIDYVRWLLGEVEQLWAFSGHQSELSLDVEDTIEIGLRMQSGVIGSIHLDYNQRPSRHHLEVIGARGVLRWESTDPAVTLYQIQAEGSDATARVVMEELRIPDRLNSTDPQGSFERNDLFLAEMRHFIAIVHQKEKPVCTLDDGIAALRLALAALKSSASGQLWVNS